MTSDVVASPRAISPSDRIDAIDVLRGIALFGVMAINVVIEFRISILSSFLVPGRLLRRLIALSKRS